MVSSSVLFPMTLSDFTGRIRPRMPTVNRLVLIGVAPTCGVGVRGAPAGSCGVCAGAATEPAKRHMQTAATVRGAIRVLVRFIRKKIYSRKAVSGPTVRILVADPTPKYAIVQGSV